MTVNYEKLDAQEFDAIVTGELNHYAICLEDRLNSFFTSYFGILGERKNGFYSLFLRREGLKFQDKIEIARAILKTHAERLRKSQRPLAKDVVLCIEQTLRMLNDVEKFKQLRNALAHGFDVTRSKEASEPKIEVEIVQRSGKSRLFVITPQSHAQMFEQLEKLLEDLNQSLRRIESWFLVDVIEEMKEHIMMHS